MGFVSVSSSRAEHVADASAGAYGGDLGRRQTEVRQLRITHGSEMGIGHALSLVHALGDEGVE